MFKSTKNILLFEPAAFAARVPPVEGRNAGFCAKERTPGASVARRD